MGEILPLLENSFDPDTTVVWDNVKFSDEKEIVIFMPYSKTTGFKGKFIDLYIYMQEVAFAHPLLCSN